MKLYLNFILKANKSYKIHKTHFQKIISFIINFIDNVNKSRDEVHMYRIIMR